MRQRVELNKSAVSLKSLGVNRIIGRFSVNDLDPVEPLIIYMANKYPRLYEIEVSHDHLVAHKLSIIFWFNKCDLSEYVFSFDPSLSDFEQSDNYNLHAIVWMEWKLGIHFTVHPDLANLVLFLGERSIGFL